MITLKSIEELKNRIDIVDIISRYISVKKSGRNYVCVCPFHDDVNPSMNRIIFITGLRVKRAGMP